MDVLRMNTAVRLNQRVREHSQQAQLVLLNCPGVPDDSGAYMCYLEALVEHIPRAILVRGSGSEVVTIFS